MKIHLSCIIGNEEKVIERFIRSFAPAVDSFVLVSATGNAGTDLSLQTATLICEELKKPLYQSRYVNADESLPHVDDFGAARQKSWEIANGLARDEDFVMWADADDLLADGAAEAIRAAAEDGKHDVYLVPYHVRGDKQIVMRERMVRARIGSKWQFPIHEQLAFKGPTTYRILKDAAIIHAPSHEKSGGHERNLAILNSATAETSRNFFYLAQEFFQTSKEKEFKRASAVALACPDLGELERYELLLQQAQTPGYDSRKLAAEAFAIMPDRREALALLTSYCIMDGDDPKALRLAELMIETEPPKRSYWSQNNEWYGWKGEELYRQCLRLNGRDEDAEIEFDIGASESPRFSIIHATLGRPEQALAIREMWLSRARHPENVEYIFGVHSFDEKSVKMLRGLKRAVTDQKGPGWNYDTAAGISTGEIIIQAQDDCYPPDGWDEALLSIIGDTSKPVFVAVNDGHRTDRLSVNTIMTRSYMERKAKRDPGENGFFHRGYATIFPDTENSFRAIQDGISGECEYIDARDFVLYHDHPMFNPAVPWDSTYAWENAPEHYESGVKLFKERNPESGPNCLDRKPLIHPYMNEDGEIIAHVITSPLMPEPEREEAFA